ncbi:hypothetical protein [Listeria booriae]|uniref:Uncharacterized protein n=1 Tax=Listeria booriae TaxID=1552123 RepID=A0A7X1A7J6_9LIST|nr:hypothetical protein [Listeria booriae]MBC1209847.1 hypothetical protein [Listeria booriae]MBC1226065.1 hypothetical protein [Listeria booriae]MBC1229122.1 hypothetical protein [Listeria booriae]MBC1232771.1 hypothetical protein [Listeria booriae]MBC1245716.1 hypothetical protein [Listeria booriae]
MLHTVVIALAILVFLQTIYFFIRKNTDMGVMFLLIGVALLIISTIG